MKRFPSKSRMAAVAAVLLTTAAVLLLAQSFERRPLRRPQSATSDLDPDSTTRSVATHPGEVRTETGDGAGTPRTEGLEAAEESGVRPVPEDGVIDAPGRYALQEDLATDRRMAITVCASDVRLDLQGHAVRFDGDPEEVAFGIMVNSVDDVTVANGRICGFRFGINAVDGRGLAIENLEFDDIPYVGVNVAGCEDVRLSNNSFTGFRYDYPIERGDDFYLVGINLGAEGYVVSDNRLTAHVGPDPAEWADVETVFILLSAGSTQGRIMRNEMQIDRRLERSYGIWAAVDNEVRIADNRICNLEYGVNLRPGVHAEITRNRILASPTDDACPVVTYGIFACDDAQVRMHKNEFKMIDQPVAGQSE